MTAAPDPGGVAPARVEQLAAAAQRVRARVSQACRAAGRDEASVTTIAVTKLHPAEDVAALADLEFTDVGEARDQEARAKRAALEGRGGPTAALRWHVVGQVQTNKARSVVRWADAVHSLDRIALADALATAAQRRRETPIDVFVQISLDGDPGRGGVPVGGLDELVDAVLGHASLRLRGVMTVLPVGVDADAGFAELAALSARVRTAHAGADAISAGMSADLEQAIRNGATHVRVGTALLGRREPNVG